MCISDIYDSNTHCIAGLLDVDWVSILSSISSSGNKPNISSVIGHSIVPSVTWSGELINIRVSGMVIDIVRACELVQREFD